MAAHSSTYVGNKSAVFPLQTLGMDVDIINSVQFSNHTGYPSWTGRSQVMDGDDLWDLVEGLKANNLMKHSHLLTGYMRSPDLLRTVLRTLDEIRAVNPDAVYVCDPVMGDHGKLYIPAELVPIYRDEVVPKATILTPNQFEAELLTDVPIRSIQDAVTAADCLHSKGVKCVVITSMCVEGDDETISLISSRVGNQSGCR
ncbi:Ribokinase-like protein [Baffinella frigidus]|nr:Ribokinase-like protein [Cryptophyta sp. CCMP2293]